MLVLALWTLLRRLLIQLHSTFTFSLVHSCKNVLSINAFLAIGKTCKSQQTAQSHNTATRVGYNGRIIQSGACTANRRSLATLGHAAKKVIKLAISIDSNVTCIRRTEVAPNARARRSRWSRWIGYSPSLPKYKFKTRRATRNILEIRLHVSLWIISRLNRFRALSNRIREYFLRIFHSWTSSTTRFRSHCVYR